MNHAGQSASVETERPRGHGPRRVLVALTAGGLVAALAVVLAGGGYLAMTSGGAWVRQAFSGRLFWTCAGILVIGSAVLGILATILWQAGAESRRQRRAAGPAGGGDGQNGSAILEFAMVLPIALMIVLIMTQASLLMGGSICVNYAAFAAARNAIVTVPLNLNDTEPHNVVLADINNSGKLRRIQQAAAGAIMPVACSSRLAPAGDLSLFQAGLKQFFGAYNQATPGWVNDDLGIRYKYALDYTTITLNPPADAQKNVYADNEDIRVIVDHTFYLAVPYAAYIFAHLGTDGVDLPFGNKEYGTKIRSASSLTNEGGQDWVDVEPFPRSAP